MHRTSRTRGEWWVWVSATALAGILLLSTALLLVVLANGVGAFWPAKLVRLSLRDGTCVLGEVHQVRPTADGRRQRAQLKVGNRDLYGADFRWLDLDTVQEQDWPADAVAVERREYGHFLGFLKAVHSTAQGAAAADTWAALAREQDRVRAGRDQARTAQRTVDRLNARIARNQLRLLRLRYEGVADDTPAVRALLADKDGLQKQFTDAVATHARVVADLRAPAAVFVDAAGTERAVALADIVRLYRPNAMSWWQKLLYYVGRIGELLAGEPREANTEGGLFPAIVGTVMMVLIMSLFSFPLGVITAVFLREYAKDGLVVRLVRIAVSNLAGVPSIVYGIFGLGFFVYGVGGSLDRLFFPERLPTPTFGTGGILWASLTLALLTVPVVIVATEEALASIPRGIREGSLALGATRLQTLVRILLPMASPGILTGFILAMARAAGEVAPLMITGVVKLAPALPVDGQFPFVHLNRKFMHLGFHIYDVGFQSPNSEAARPMVFVTTLLLVLIVLVLTSTAIVLRTKMKRRYTISAF